jgi:hypothetical protein
MLVEDDLPAAVRSGMLEQVGDGVRDLPPH